MNIKNLIITLLAVVTGLVIIAFCLSKALNAQKADNERLQSNIEALRGEIEKGFSKDGKETTIVKQQTLTKSELKEIIHEELSSLGIKERDVKQAITIAEKQKVDVHLDSVNVNQIGYKDSWIDITICGDSAHISGRDSLLIINHAKTKKFLWWTWKRYSGKTTIKNYSPYSHITGIESIDVEL